MSPVLPRARPGVAIPYDSAVMSDETRGLIRSVLAKLGLKLRFPQLFAIAATLFFFDLLIPDLIPFIDEILLGLLTLLLGSMQERGEAVVETADKPPVKDVTPPDGG